MGRLAGPAAQVLGVVALGGDHGGVAYGVGSRAATGVREFPDGASLAGQRLDLELLRVEHAEEMAELLDDPGLHVFIGGVPASLPDLRERYERQASGRSPDGSQHWLNWVMRRREDQQALGTVQATVTQEGRSLSAEVAWVVAARHQRHGYAREAAGVMVAWLWGHGVARVVAHVHPDNRASQRVAAAVGLTATTTVVDGEVRWQGDLNNGPRDRSRSRASR